MTRPVRLQLSRAKGFNLQAHSLSVNGLRAVNVARPGRYGNPFAIGKMTDGRVPIDNAGACAMFEELFRDRQLVPDYPRSASGLRGNNVACWCSLSEPCHGDTWLRIANGDAQ